MANAQQDHAANTAALQAFSLYEITEQILIGLDFKTLLLAQRVNTTIRYIVHNSKPLKQKLFWVPATFEEAKQLDMIDDQTLISADENEFGDQSYCRVLNISALKFMYVADINDNLEGNSLQLQLSILSNSISTRRGVGSWERMYPFQPPAGAHLRYEFCFGECVHAARYKQRNNGHAPTEGSFVDCEYSRRGDMTYREMIDEMEECAMDEGCLIRWDETEIDLSGPENIWRYGDHKVEVERLRAEDSDGIELADY